MLWCFRCLKAMDSLPAFGTVPLPGQDSAVTIYECDAICAEHLAEVLLDLKRDELDGDDLDEPDSNAEDEVAWTREVSGDDPDH